MLTRLMIWSLAAAVLMSVGCSPDYVKPGVYVEVHGKIFLDGGPVRNAKVVFVPEHLEIGEEFAISSGTTDTFGDFELKTVDGREGAIVGKHRVYVSRIVDESELQDPSALKDKSTQQQFANSNDEINFAEHREHVWDLVDQSVEQPTGEQIPFYYNLKSELIFDVIPGRGIQRVKFELSSVDPMLDE